MGKTPDNQLASNVGPGGDTPLVAMPMGEVSLNKETNTSSATCSQVSCLSTEVTIITCANSPPIAVPAGHAKTSEAKYMTIWKKLGHLLPVVKRQKQQLKQVKCQTQPVRLR